MSFNRLDRNANTPERQRRNWQRLAAKGSATGTILVKPPITNSSTGLGLAFATSTGLGLVSSTLAILFADLTITGSSAGIKVGTIAESQVTNLVSDLAGKAPTTRLINTNAPLQGGGDLTADRTLSILQAGTSANGYLSSTDWNTFNGKGSGTVTSVALALPGIFTISGSPVTTTGTLTGTLATQASTLVFCGPASGAAAAPTFRALQATDIPALPESQITGLTADLAARALASRLINTTTPLQGGGDLSSDRTLTIVQSDTSHNGYLSSTDWNTFNNHIGSTSVLPSVAADPGSPTDGQAWYNSTTKQAAFREAGITAHLVGTLSVAIANSSSTSNTTTETAFTGTGYNTVVLPANSLTAGRLLRIKGEGITNETSSPITFTLNFWFNFNAAGSTLVASMTGQSLITPASGLPFDFEVNLPVRTTGASGSVQPGGWVNIFVATGKTLFYLGNATANTINTTIANTINVTCQWGTAAAGNVAFLTQLSIELLN